MEGGEVGGAWTQYVEKLYRDNSKSSNLPLNVITADRTQDIGLDELKWPIKKS